ncbi:inactive protein kinase [Tanacetum coccineum]
MVGQVILVSIEAGIEVTDYALEWAVQNVIKPMDTLILLAIIPSPDYCLLPVKSTQAPNSSKGLFSRLLRKRSTAGKNDVSDKVGFVDEGRDIPQRVYDVCAQMIHHLFSLHKVVKVHTEVKVVAYAPVGSVAMVATEMRSTWVILDQRLKDEADCCIKLYLNCNVVVIDGSYHNILRSVNFPFAVKTDQEQVPTMGDMLGALPAYTQANSTSPTQVLTPSSFNTQNTSSSTATEVALQKTRSQVLKHTPPRPKQYSESQLNMIPAFVIMAPRRSISGLIEEKVYGNGNRTSNEDDMKKETKTVPFPARRSVDLRRLRQQEKDYKNQSGQQTLRRVSFSHTNTTVDRTSSIRRDMSLSLKKPPTPPPLCSICKHTVPVIGRSPRSHEEIEKATDGFSESNFLAEGGYGHVYRGILSDGQVVAVKKRKMVSAQGAAEFCSEVEVLKSAQHKNLVMLIGYCIEKEWLLVYEFACNGSLDRHLYGTEEGEVMTWKNRMKVACGAARALRYFMKIAGSVA